jgi:hypothetical protein
MVAPRSGDVKKCHSRDAYGAAAHPRRRAARDPSGGFDIVVEDTNDDAPRLHHVDEAASGAPTWIETAPSFAEAKMQKSSTCGFELCSLATAADGTVFFQSYARLWKVSP